MVYRSTSASLAPRPHPPPMVTCHIYLSATHRAPPLRPEEVTSVWPRPPRSHPVLFASRFSVHTINLERGSERGDGGGELVGGRRGGKVGQRTSTEAKAAAPCSPRPAPRQPSALPFRLRVDSWRGTSGRAARWLGLFLLFCFFFFPLMPAM